MEGAAIVDERRPEGEPHMGSLRGKIMTGYVFITALTVIMGTLSAMNYVSFSGTLNQMMVQNYNSVLASSYMTAALERQDSWALLDIIGDPGAAGQYESARADFLGWLARAEDNVTLPEEDVVVGSIRASFLKYTAAVEALVRGTGSGGQSSSTAGSTYRETVLPSFSETRSACDALLKLNDSAMRAVQDRMTGATTRAAWTTAIVASSALFIALIASYTVSERITRPIRQLAESADRIGRGNLDEGITIESRDEVGVLAREFRSMVNNLRAVRASDIAEVLASRRKLAAVIDGIRDGVVILSEDGRVEVANPTAARALGIEAQEVVGLKIASILKDPRLIQLVDEADDVSADATEPMSIDIEIEPGRRGFFLAEMLRVKSEGDVVARVLVLRDVTAVEETERAKSQFMSAVSHELRTPLTSMSMGVGLLSESKLLADNPREAELLMILRGDVARLAKLVDELFAISRLQKGQMPMLFERATPSELVEAAVVPFRSQAIAQSIALIVDLPADLPPVRVDREKIVWVISNIVGNALRYTDAGGSITVAATRHASKVYISVVDSGTGIPKDKQDAIFEPYVQISRGKKGGAGLGLAISRDVVRAHGGRIWVESEVGHGSTFTFSVPVEP